MDKRLISAPPRAVSKVVSRQLDALVEPFDKLRSESNDIRSAQHFDRLEGQAQDLADGLVSAFRGKAGTRG